VNTDRSQPATSGEDWFRPGTHSLWLYIREGQGEPALVSVYEWEIADLRGVLVEGAWGDLNELKDGKEAWDVDHQMLCRETIAQDELSVQYFAELVALGQLLRIGEMPPVGKYAETPLRPAIQPEPATTT
jgi:hypothetical protein